MQSREDELEEFKRRIDLAQYAASRGYERDPKDSSVNSIAMRHDDGSKILIGVGSDEHWIYCSVFDPADKGTIIDFVTRRTGWNLGQVRKELRPWLSPGSCPAPPSPTARSYPKPEPMRVDLQDVQRRYRAMPIIRMPHRYLTDRRAIPPEVYLDPLFAGRIRQDERGNVVFPHWNAKGQVCGYEVKNDGFTGFSKHGMKGLFASGFSPKDRCLIIAEVAIDALSYAALFGLEKSRFVSTAGTMNPHQPALLRSAMLKLPDGAEVVAAVDHDEGGDGIYEQIEAIYSALRRPEITLRRHSPPTPGEDWNDALRASMGETGPFAPTPP